jgi:hypothetical protein
MSRFVAERLSQAEAAFRPGGHLVVVEHTDELMRRGRAALADYLGTAPSR